MVSAGVRRVFAPAPRVVPASTVPGNLRPAGRMRPADHIRAARRVQPKMGTNVHFQLDFT